jgi:hypothetical protein
VSTSSGLTLEYGSAGNVLMTARDRGAVGKRGCLLCRQPPIQAAEIVLCGLSSVTWSAAGNRCRAECISWSWSVSFATRQPKFAAIAPSFRAEAFVCFMVLCFHGALKRRTFFG